MEADNLKIKWRHQPEPHRVGEPRGTECIVEDRNDPDVVLGAGKAQLHENDQFCRDTGRKLSLRRALANAKIPRKKRAQVWEVYRTAMTPNPRW